MFIYDVRMNMINHYADYVKTPLSLNSRGEIPYINNMIYIFLIIRYIEHKVAEKAVSLSPEPQPRGRVSGTGTSLRTPHLPCFMLNILMYHVHAYIIY